MQEDAGDGDGRRLWAAWTGGMVVQVAGEQVGLLVAPRRLRPVESPGGVGQARPSQLSLPCVQRLLPATCLTVAARPKAALESPSKSAAGNIVRVARPATEGVWLTRCWVLGGSCVCVCVCRGCTTRWASLMRLCLDRPQSLAVVATARGEGWVEGEWVGWQLEGGGKS